jgi:hypothetical protein
LETFVSKRLFPDAIESQKSPPEESPPEESPPEELPPEESPPEESPPEEPLPEELPPEKPPIEKKRIKEEMQETTDERDKFFDLASKFKFTNPRQLLRLRNSYRLLKGLSSEKEYNREMLMTMLFWQEFLHNWPLRTRNLCISAINDDTIVQKIKPVELQRIVQNINKEISELLLHEEEYVKIARFVRMVILPHNEEGVLDTQEKIGEWLEKEKEEEEKEKQVGSKKVKVKKKKSPRPPAEKQVSIPDDKLQSM